MQDQFINKVEASGILTVDLLEYKPREAAVFLDIKDFLYEEMILREKDFKEQLATTDWEKYRNKPVALGCTADAIVPSWAYMSFACYLEGVASHIDYCEAEALDLSLWKRNIEAASFDHLQNKKVVVRAYNNLAPALYMSISQKLKPIVKSLMYGEAGLPKVIWKNK